MYAPGDDEETRRRKVQFTIASILVAPAGLVWGVLYFLFGERTVAAIPVAYPFLTGLDLLILFRLRRFELYRQCQQVLILVLPFALQLGLGGFVGSWARGGGHGAAYASSVRPPIEAEHMRESRQAR